MTLESRVTTVPHYPSLARALQQDMAQTAIVLRNVVYDLMATQPHSVTTDETKLALTLLDFPHFIPIENTEDELRDEYEIARRALFETSIFDVAGFGRSRMIVRDIEAELDRRAKEFKRRAIEDQDKTAPIELPDVEDYEGGE